MTKDDKEVVSVLRDALADKVGRERFDLWFGSKTRLELNDNILTVGAPNRFFQEWLRANFRGEIENACRSALGRALSIHFCIDGSLEGTAGTLMRQGGEDLRPESIAVMTPGMQAALEPKASGNVETAATATAVRPRFLSLKSFVTGPSNRLAWAAAEMVVERPGSMSPLVLHGPTGVGKTHLLQGIWGAIRKSHPAISALYLTAEQFTGTFLQALRGSGLPSFRQKYRGVGLLVIDDLQFFCGKRYTQMELFYTVDALAREGRQVIFAADRPPAELGDLGPELSARLQGGMVCRMEPPEYETRLGIVREMAKRMELRVPDDVQEFIAARLTSHARELSGALCRLEATSRAIGRPIDAAMAEDSLAELIRASRRPVRLTDIEKAICDTFGLAPQSLQSNCKAKRVSQPRMLAMWLARKYTRAALCEIGEYFGRRAHSTVVSAQKRVDGWLSDRASLELADSTWKIDEAIRKVEQRLMAS